MSEWIRARRLEANRKQGNDMSDIREAFEAHYFSYHGGDNMTFDHANSYYLNRDVNGYWLAFQAGQQAALSANGGEAVPVAWVVFADNGNIRIWGREKPEAFPDAAPLYLAPTVKGSLTVQSEPVGYADPDTLTDYRAGDRLHMPVYRPDASKEWQSGIPVYLHPAPPSVAVPFLRHLLSVIGGVLAGCEPNHVNEEAGYIGGQALEELETCEKTLRDMLTDAPSPDHSGDANKMVTPSVPESEALPVRYYVICSEDEDLFEPDDDGLDSALSKLAEREAAHTGTAWDLIAVVDLDRLRTAGDEGEARPTHNGGESDG